MVLRVRLIQRSISNNCLIDTGVSDHPDLFDGQFGAASTTDLSNVMFTPSIQKFFTSYTIWVRSGCVCCDVSSVCMLQMSDMCGLSSWTVLGSTDGTNFVVLDMQSDYSFGSLSSTFLLLNQSETTPLVQVQWQFQTPYPLCLAEIQLNYQGLYRFFFS